MIKLLGIKIFYMKEYFRKKYGNEELRNLISQIESKNSREVIDGVILSANWYDNDAWVDFQKAIVKKFGKDELRLAEYDSAERQLSGFYGIIVKLVSMGTVLKKAEKLWLKNFSQGKLLLVSLDENKLILKLENFPTSDIQYWAITKNLEHMAKVLSGKTYEGEYKKIANSGIEMMFNLVKS